MPKFLAALLVALAAAMALPVHAQTVKIGAE